MLLGAAEQPPLLPGLPGQLRQPAQQLDDAAAPAGLCRCRLGENGGLVSRATVSCSVCVVCGQDSGTGRGGNRSRNCLFLARVRVSSALMSVDGVRGMCLTARVTRSSRTARTATGGRNPVPAAVVSARLGVGLTSVVSQHAGHHFALGRNGDAGYRNCPNAPKREALSARELLGGARTRLATGADVGERS
jgi:hypothetical protein